MPRDVTFDRAAPAVAQVPRRKNGNVSFQSLSHWTLFTPSA